MRERMVWAAPLVEELAGPGGRGVIPELLECFLEQVSEDGFQVVAQQIAKPEVLLVAEIVTAFEQQPPILETGGSDGRAFYAQPASPPMVSRRCSTT